MEKRYYVKEVFSPSADTYVVMDRAEDRVVAKCKCNEDAESIVSSLNGKTLNGGEETFYGYFVQYGMQKAIVMIPRLNELGSDTVPMLYSEENHIKHKEHITHTAQEIASRHNVSILLIKFKNGEVIDMISSENTTLH